MKKPSAAACSAKAEGLLAEKWRLLPEFLHARGLVKQHIKSYDHLISVELQKILEANREVRSEHSPSFFVKYTKIRIGRPEFKEESGVTNDTITPMECRTRNLTYSAPIYVSVHYSTQGAKRGRQVRVANDVVIGNIPIMLRSKHCVLAGKSDGELAKIKECPFDPGGYFVIKGHEKVVLVQEQLSRNRILVELDENKCTTAQVVSATHERKSLSRIIQKKGALYLKNNIFVSDIPIFIAMKALGVESDQEVVSLIGPESELQDRLDASLRESAITHGVHTQVQAQRWIGGQLRPGRGRSFKRSKVDEAREVMNSVILPHVPVISYDFRDKAIYVGLMVRRCLLAMNDARHLSDKDYYGNKRLELAGGLLSLLFEDLFKNFNSKVKGYVDKVLSKPNRAMAEVDVPRILGQFQDTITNGFGHHLATGNWSLKRFRMEQKGVTETVQRLSYIASLGHMTRIRSHVEKTRKLSGPRALQPSQWGLVCPSDTPEGDQCGLVKSLALLASVTSDEDRTPLVSLLYSLGVRDAALLTGEEIYGGGAHLVMLNGRLLGITHRPKWIAQQLRRLRRCGLVVSEFVSVYVNSLERSLSVSCDGGRVCRPLIIVDNCKPRVTAEQLAQLQARCRDFRSFVLDGCIEYTDANEENSCLVALTEAEITPATTHLELDPVTILGVVSGLIPYPHHNQSPRNTYQCAMGKQAIGTVGLNQLTRCDVSPMNVLVYPHKPLVRSRVLDFVKFEHLGAGQNAIVAVCSFTGYDIEDAIVLNRASVDRGFGRVSIYRKYTTAVRNHRNHTTDMLATPPRRDDPLHAHIDDARWAQKSQRYRALGLDGLAEVGAMVSSGDVLVNRRTPTDTSGDMLGSTQASSTKPVTFTNSPEVYREAYSGRVDKVVITSSETEKFLIKLQVRDTRSPEVGDKFASRHGQKGVIGTIMAQEDMPFNEDGICPDLVMNPHGFPSRMTVGKMIELVAGKAALQDGKLRFGTAFGGTPAEECGRVLIEKGYHYGGKELLYSGSSGEPLKAYIFMGPVYYQRLKHMVKDKMFARSRGPHVVLTRQPTQGRARDGGLRVGEMERDCLVAHGTSLLLIERLLVSSDPFTATICRTCGLICRPGCCEVCKSLKRPYELADLRLPYACKLLFQELLSMNVSPRIDLATGGYFDIEGC